MSVNVQHPLIQCLGFILLLALLAHALYIPYVLFSTYLYHTYFILVSCKTRNHPQTSQTTHEPAKPPTNQPATNHPKTSQISDKPPKNQPIIIRKSVLNVTKNFSNNVKQMLNLQPFYSISSTFSSNDQSQVGIEGKWCEII